MKIASKFWPIVGLVMLFGAATASAQNIVDNPYFDDDLNGWSIIFGDVSASHTMNYATGDSMRIVSADLAANGGMAVLSQCVPIDEVLYVATTWVNSSCAGQTLEVFWADDSCLVSPASIIAQSTVTDAWQQLTAVGTPTHGSTHAVVTLLNPSTCASHAYFDDVSLQPDYIFADNFEVTL